MSTKIKLTPKECLYLDDALSQLCAIHTRLSSEEKMIEDKEVKKVYQNTLQVLSEEFENCKQLLKEASE